MPATYAVAAYCALASFGVGFPNPRCSCRHADTGLQTFSGGGLAHVRFS